ncbi:hypothetical protein NN561_016091 [Cricetulus griseus]
MGAVRRSRDVLAHGARDRVTGVGCQRSLGPGGLRARLGAGLAGAPGFLGAGPPPLAKDVASSYPPASAWPGLGALSLNLSQRSRLPRGASQEGSVRRGHLPRRGLAASASGSPRAPPGRPGALGPTLLGYGTGEVWGRGASGD